MTQQEINDRIQAYKNAIKEGKTTLEFGNMIIESLKNQIPSQPEAKLTEKIKRERLALFGR